MRRRVGALLVRCGFEVAAEVDSFTALHDVVQRTQPAVVVLSLPLPGMSTLAAVQALREEAPESAIVVLSAFETLGIAALEAGARALVPEDDPRMLVVVLDELAASWIRSVLDAASGLAGVPGPRQAADSDEPIAS